MVIKQWDRVLRLHLTVAVGYKKIKWIVARTWKVSLGTMTRILCVVWGWSDERQARPCDCSALCRAYRRGSYVAAGCYTNGRLVEGSFDGNKLNLFWFLIYYLIDSQPHASRLGAFAFPSCSRKGLRFEMTCETGAVTAPVRVRFIVVVTKYLIGRQKYWKIFQRFIYIVQ